MSCYNILKEKGLRLTPQRRIIIDLIHDNSEHLTADSIITCVQQKMPGVNKSTIYRTLDLLEHTGCVFKSESDNGFIYHHSDQGHHHHLVCEKCGCTIECDEDLLSPLIKLISSNYGFQVNFHHLVMKGLCNKCHS